MGQKTGRQALPPSTIGVSRKHGGGRQRGDQRKERMGRDRGRCVCSWDRGVRTSASSAALPAEISRSPNYGVVQSTFVEGISGG